MPRINLLPVRAARKVDTARNELMGIAVVLVALICALYAWYASVDSDIYAMEERISVVRAEIVKLEKLVVKVEEFKKKTETLERKLDVIDTLKKQKVGPAKMLDDLSTILTRLRKVWLTKLSSSGLRMTMEGGAMEHEDISEFQLALERESPFFRQVTLTSVEAVKEKDVTYLRWTLTCEANFSAG